MPDGAVLRVVPLAPDVTELAFALGGGDLVAAVPAAAATAVRSWRFKPATKSGVRVKVHITQTIPFKP